MYVCMYVCMYALGRVVAPALELARCGAGCLHGSGTLVLVVLGLEYTGGIMSCSRLLDRVGWGVPRSLCLLYMLQLKRVSINLQGSYMYVFNMYICMYVCTQVVCECWLAGAGIK
jgi:hypothetical protein